MRNRTITNWTWLGHVSQRHGLGIGIAALSLATGCSAAAPLPEPTTAGPAAAPGDITGENVGGNWSAVGKDGKPLVAK